MSEQVILKKEDFGVFWKYINDDTITDVDYNGHELWVKNIYGESRIDGGHADCIEKGFQEGFLLRSRNGLTGFLSCT